MNTNRDEKKRLIGIIGITALVCFTISALFYVLTLFIGGYYSITFDKDNVSRVSVKKFNDVRNIIEGSYYEDVDTSKLIEGAITGMADSLNDPYTVYYTKQQMEWFEDRQKPEDEYVGIGLQIMLDKNGIITGLEPFDNSPAKEAGIRQGDKILKVDGKDITGLKDESLVASMIKGQENTSVVLTIYRESEDKTFDLTVTRRKINAILNIRSEMLDNDVAYIKLKLFDTDISKNFISQLDSLLKQGAKYLIIDVRDNPGGSYTEVVDLADRILPEGLIVYTEDKQKKKVEQISDSTGLDIPIVVLTNGNSASASEILAGALKDHKKATLVGTTTFGKGLVQTIHKFDDGSAIKVTIARYFTPNGICIQGEGIKPDVEVKIDEKYSDTPISALPFKDDAQLQKALEILKK